MANLKSGLAAQQSTLLRQTQTNMSSVRASFKVAKLIASCGKSFGDGEFIKKCLNAVAEEVCPDKKDVQRCERGESVRVYSHQAN